MKVSRCGMYSAVSLLLLSVFSLSPPYFNEWMASSWDVVTATQSSAASVAIREALAEQSAACLGMGRNASLPSAPPRIVSAFYLPVGHNPVPVHVSGLFTVGEVKQAAVDALALPTKLGRAVTAADVRVFVVSHDVALRLVAGAAEPPSEEEKGAPLGALNAFDARGLCEGSCLLLELDKPLSRSSAVCAKVMSRLIASAPATEWPPSCVLSKEMRAAFEGPNGSMPITSEVCFAQRYEGGGEVDWNKAFVDQYCAGLAAGTTQGTYEIVNDEFVRRTLNSIPGMVGSTGMVLGSEKPWVECLALNAGAATVWTFEYASITSTHPKLKAKPCKIMAAEHMSGNLPLVDWIATYSSLEHSGLGRYGDALNPDGDKEAVLQALCMLKPGGIFLLGLPTTCGPNGFIAFNPHRFYGFKRLAYITEGFELERFAAPCVDGITSNFAANIIVLRKPLGDLAPAKLTSDDFLRAAELSNNPAR